jgi:hypothetical protein
MFVVAEKQVTFAVFTPGAWVLRAILAGGAPNCDKKTCSRRRNPGRRCDARASSSAKVPTWRTITVSFAPPSWDG